MFLGFSYDQESMFNSMFLEIIDSKQGLSNSSVSSIVQYNYGFYGFQFKMV